MNEAGAVGFHGTADAGPPVRVGMIGCGSHGWRNIVPTLHFTPLRLHAVCDLDLARARAWVEETSAVAAHDDHHRLLDDPDIDAVIVVTGLDERGRPRYPALARDCLAAGKHVWIEKPPASSVGEIDAMAAAAADSGRHVMVGLKKMFAPANLKAAALAAHPDFGRPVLLRVEYPQRIPTVEEMRRYLVAGEPEPRAMELLDHLCHPLSVVLLLAGAPSWMRIDRAGNGAGVLTLGCGDGMLATVSLTWGGAPIDGLERTVLTSDRGRHVVVDDNTTVEYHRMPVPGYGDVADFYAAPADEATAVWHPEHSLGQLYNKGVFALGYWGELQEFAAVVRDDRPPVRAGLADARLVTSVFEGFAEEPGTTIDLGR